MNSSTSSEHASRSTGIRGSKQTEGTAATTLGPEHDQPGGVTETMSQLSRDVAALKDTFAQLVSQLGDAGAKTVRGMSQTVASRGWCGSRFTTTSTVSASRWLRLEKQSRSGWST